MRKEITINFEERDLELNNMNEEVVETRPKRLSNLKSPKLDTKEEYEELGSRYDAESSKNSDIVEEMTAQLLTVDAVVKKFETNTETGLTNEEAYRRLARDGHNELTPRKDWNPFMKYIFSLFQGFGPIMWISFVLMFITYIPLGGDNPYDYNLAVALVILSVIFIQGLFSWYQDYESSNVLASFANLVPAQINVVRGGQVEVINTKDLVLGDKVLFENGVIVPADVRVIESHGLKADTSALTGEPGAVELFVQPVTTSLLESRNCLFLGTSIVGGKGSGIVVATGDRCSMARILKMSTGAQEVTTLDYEINLFIIVIALLAIFIGVAVYVIWAVWVHKSYPHYISQGDVITNCISILLGVVPTGMPVALTASLTLIARRLCNEYKVLVSRMGTVETLGCVSIIGTDKTGTLTMNDMRVVRIIVDKEYFDVDTFTELEKLEVSKDLATYAILCSSSSIHTTVGPLKGTNGASEIITKVVGGNGVDIGILTWAIKLDDVSKTRASHTAIADLPFNSDNKFSVHIYSKHGLSKPFMIMIGSPELVMLKCKFYRKKQNSNVELSEEAIIKFNDLIEQSAALGQRVVAVAESPVDIAMTSEGYDIFFVLEKTNLTLVGLFGLQDPPRANIKDVVSTCRAGNVRVMMITGDHPSTATAIARQTGIVTYEKVERFDSYHQRNRSYSVNPDNTLKRKTLFELIKTLLNLQQEEDHYYPDYRNIFENRAITITGQDLHDVSSTHWNWICQFEEIVFARTTPDQKLQIVHEFQKRGHTVAMTGDGVNDAAALRRADCGVCMQSGADFAREAADMVLLTDDFGAVERGIIEGRLLFCNLKRVINYLLPAGSFAETLPAVVNIILGIPLPLSTFQVITVCIGTDIFGATSLIYTPAEGNIMNQSPRNVKTDRLVDTKIFLYAYAFVGNYYVLAAFTNFFYYFGTKGIHMNKLFFAWEWGSEGYAGLSTEEQNTLLATGQSIYFVTLVVCQLGNLLVLQTRKTPFGATVNGEVVWPKLSKYNIIAMLLELLVVLVLIYLPGCNETFGTAPVDAVHWGIAGAFSVGLILLSEIRKWLCYYYPGGIVDRWSW